MFKKTRKRSQEDLQRARAETQQRNAVHLGIAGPEYQPEKPPSQQQKLTPSSKTLSSMASASWSASPCLAENAGKLGSAIRRPGKEHRTRSGGSFDKTRQHCRGWKRTAQRPTRRMTGFIVRLKSIGPIQRELKNIWICVKRGRSAVLVRLLVCR